MARYPDVVGVNVLGVTEQFKLGVSISTVKKRRKSVVLNLYKAKPEIVSVEAMFQVINSIGNIGKPAGSLVITLLDNSLELSNVDPITGIITLDVDDPAIPTTQPNSDTPGEIAITDIEFQKTIL